MPLHGDDGDTGIAVRLIGSDRERGLGRFETATCPDRIPSVMLPLPAPMRRPRDRRGQVDKADWEVTPARDAPI